MSQEPPIPAELWAQVPPAAQAALLALLASYEQRLSHLQEQVSHLQHQLGLNSSNSSRPPSSDPPPGHAPANPRVPNPGTPSSNDHRCPPTRRSTASRLTAAAASTRWRATIRHRCGTRSSSCPLSNQRSPITCGTAWRARSAAPPRVRRYLRGCPRGSMARACRPTSPCSAAVTA
jgi:hypothetical protein